MAQWKKTEDGLELKTETLVLVVRKRDGAGWEAIAFNAGRYKKLATWPFPLTGHINDAKRVCLSMAQNVLSEERETLERVEVE